MDKKLKRLAVVFVDSFEKYDRNRAGDRLSDTTKKNLTEMTRALEREREKDLIDYQLSCN